MTNAALLAAVAFCALVAYLIPVLVELKRTLRTYRNLEPKVVALLDNSSRIAANVEEISQQVLNQSTRIDHITGEATEMVETVKKTVDLYNRTIARPAVFIASLASGARGISSVLFRNKRV